MRSRTGKATLNPKRAKGKGCDLELALMCTTTSMNEGEPPFKRRRTTILMLPDDVVLNCLARVSRLYYPTLSLVSKRFRSLLSSMELYQTRALLPDTESCLYVVLRHSCNSVSNPQRWFTLIRRPNSSKRILVPISSPNFPSARWSKVAAVGSNIYAIGGMEHNIPHNASSSVMVMDCRSHTWCEAPSMHLARESHSVCVSDGKIYAIGGCKNPHSTNLMEVFDTKTQTWEFLQIPVKELCNKASQLQIVWYEGTLYVSSPEKAYMRHKKGRWLEVDLKMYYGWRRSSSYCVIENVFYRFYDRTIDWFDSKERLWKSIKGLESLPRFSNNQIVKLVDYGGQKLAVLWEEYVSFKYPREKVIWCAEITIEKRQKGEIWGMLEWFDVIYTTDELYSLVHSLAITV